MWHFKRCLVWLWLLLLVRSGWAEDAFYRVPWGELELSEGRLPSSEEGTGSAWWLRSRKLPYAILDGEGEVYVSGEGAWRARGVASQPVDMRRMMVVRTAAARDVTGRMFAPTSDSAKLVMVRFKVPASRADREARTTFYRLKQSHYESLLAEGAPGAAWFRHEARQAQLALGERPGEVTATASPDFPGRRERTGDLADTYAMFTGGRAMSENLQLDRILTAARGGAETVELKSLEGITVREIDWKPLIAATRPELDPLASKIPADQHAVFFPSFDAAVAMADEMAAQSALVLELAEPRSTNALTLDRYQKQMCLQITDLARLLGPAVVQSVAITGSDPYFRTGTDVAVLFETADAKALWNMLIAQRAMQAGKQADVQVVQGEVDGLAYQGVVTPGRGLCSYMAKLDNLVIVTNSLHQLSQLVSVSTNKVPSLSSLDEFTFFRQRYARGDEGESAFLFLSDATIRRWCGPRWRIATSRRTRDLAVVAEIQAGQLDRLVDGKVQTGPVYTDLPLGEKAELTLTPEGVRCSTVGSLAFMTPIAEMSIERVTQAEADAYRQWRARYQQNWRWAFDPIGLRIGVNPGQLSADLTIMPLIWGTDYRELVAISQGAAIAAGAGDPHGALVHAVLAVNTKSEMMRRQSEFARMMTSGVYQADPLGWLGQSVCLYFDDSPFWDELGKVASEDLGKFMEEKGWSVPAAVRAEVSNGLKLTAFLAAVRAFIEQVSPGMLNWESLTYNDQPYVKVTPTERATGRNEEVRKMAVFYSASGKSLVVSLNEDVVKRAIDREVERGKLEASGEEPRLPVPGWLGENLALHVDQKALHVFASLGTSQYQALMQSRAWSNLPILNAWKRRYPAQDPLALHERYWHTRLVCPGGGQYVWNEQWQTMESTVYGCPAVPKEGPVAAPELQAVKHANFGVTFENQGLRARVSLDR